MDKLKQWVALTMVAALAVLAAGWFLLVSPKRGEASDFHAKTVSQESTNSQLGITLATLKAQAKALPAKEAVLATVAAKIPDNPALPALIRALDAAATAAGVELVSIVPSKPLAVAPTAQAAAQPQAAAGAGTGSTAKPAVTTAAPGAAAVALNRIPVSLNIVGGYFQVAQFLDSLESLTRAFKVRGFNLTPGENPVKPPPATAIGAVPTAGRSAVETGRSLMAAINGDVFMTTLVVQPAALTPATKK